MGVLVIRPGGRHAKSGLGAASLGLCLCKFVQAAWMRTSVALLSDFCCGKVSSALANHAAVPLLPSRSVPKPLEASVRDDSERNLEFSPLPAEATT